MKCRNCKKAVPKRGAPKYCSICIVGVIDQAFAVSAELALVRPRIYPEDKRIFIQNEIQAQMRYLRKQGLAARGFDV